jgi:hypothetical protein
MEPTPVKPGYKTTEFWLTIIATVIGLLESSGVIGAGTQAEHVIGMVAGILTALGYTVSRGIAKKGQT